MLYDLYFSHVWMHSCMQRPCKAAVGSVLGGVAHSSGSVEVFCCRMRSSETCGRSREQAVATLRSPQFRRALDVFTAALVSGRLDLRHFGLDPKVWVSLSVLDMLTEDVEGRLEVWFCVWS